LGAEHFKALDLEYLTLKYRNLAANSPEERDRVIYKFFYADFEELDGKGLANKIYGLSDSELQILASDKKGGALFTSDIPQKFKDFYEYIYQWMVKHNKTNNFCEKLCSEDVGKSGYLKARQIDKILFDIGLDFTKKQVGQVIYPLHQDIMKRYCWPELIELIFGKKQWKSIKFRYKLH
jgi:hypothetical protein